KLRIAKVKQTTTTESTAPLQRHFHKPCPRGAHPTRPGQDQRRENQAAVIRLFREAALGCGASFPENPGKGDTILAGGYNPAPWPLAGISALARLSMLNEDAQTSLAVSQAEIKKLEDQGIVTKKSRSERDIELEVWAYDPRSLCGDESAYSRSLFARI
ncbi:MAG: hypothetical protein MZV49_05480, partial [Rhodopseudomonas palustris]|nr:hypothetical protein [Rhodopseudomonas palustris]